MSVQHELSRLIRPAVEGLGFEFVGLEYLSNPKHRLVRVFIDRRSNDDSDGVTVDDCAEVSDELSALLDVEDPVAGAYSLEVSSPGIERPLFEPEHYRRFVGERAVVHLFAPLVDGGKRRKLAGRIVEADDSRVVLDVDGEAFEIAFDAIRRAHLKADMDALLSGDN
ncbi:MAG: ribosome maturation factor RimP [Wenzhouxiangellaceae bacterium]|nr:ribosome maturation factor RimP [Wenzhouxiangellaceae bacterium]